MAIETTYPYTPRQSSFETLKKCLVGRKGLLNELLADIQAQAGAETLQHWMILGTRGMGKSHLIALVYHTVKDDQTLAGRWLPVLMHEEEQEVFSLHSLFIRIIAQLGEELTRNNDPKAAEATLFIQNQLEKGNKPEEVVEEAAAWIKDFVAEGGKRLLVLLENADDLFTRCLPQKNDLKKLRGILQNENVILLLATAPMFFDRISRSSEPLYEFFKTRRLEPLTFGQAVDLLNHWATLAVNSGHNGKKKLSFKKDDYRLRVLFHLTGGNPRILLFLYMAISGQDGIESAATTFGKLLEEDLSAYYLSRMRDLSNQVQPIIIAMAKSDRNLTQAEIARLTFLPPRSIGTAMVRLAREGLIKPVSGKKGKNTPYTLTDPLFRHWQRWRTGIRERKVIEALIEFLSIWYKRKELEQWTGGDTIIAEYCREALVFRQTPRFRGILETLTAAQEQHIDDQITAKDFHGLFFKTISFLKECGLDKGEAYATVIRGLKEHGVIREAEQYLVTLSKRKRSCQETDTFFCLGELYRERGNFKAAEEEYQRAVEEDPEDALTWKMLGITRIKQGKHAGAEEALKQAVKLDDKNVDYWKGLGITRGLQGNHAGAEEALKQAVNLDGKDADSWKGLGMTRGLQGNHAGAEEALKQAVKLDDKDADSWKWLGVARRLQKNHAGAEEALKQAVNLDGKDADSWKGLGMARWLQGNHAGAEKALKQAVNLDPTNPGSLDALGIVSYKLFRFKKAIEIFMRGGMELAINETWPYNNYCEYFLRDSTVSSPLSLCKTALDRLDTKPAFASFIHFLMARIHLKNQDRTPFRAALQSGVAVASDLAEEDRRELYGTLLAFLVDTTFHDNFEETKAYIETFMEISPESGVLFQPLLLVVEYLAELYGQDKRRGRGQAEARARRQLDTVPMELMGPVEEMIHKVEDNIRWWKGRPENLQ